MTYYNCSRKQTLKRHNVIDFLVRKKGMSIIKDPKGIKKWLQAISDVPEWEIAINGPSKISLLFPDGDITLTIPHEEIPAGVKRDAHLILFPKRRASWCPIYSLRLSVTFDSGQIFIDRIMLLSPTNRLKYCDIPIPPDLLNETYEPTLSSLRWQAFHLDINIKQIIIL